MIAIVPGPPTNWVAVLPTSRPVNTPFRLCLKGEDRWGNPSNVCDAMFQLTANLPLADLPETVTFSPGEFSRIVEGLQAEMPGDLVIQLRDHAGDLVAESNPMRIVEDMQWTPVWGDLHGQSEETIGTNSVHDYFSFGRDKAFADILGHQGNDFQITKQFWAELNSVTRDMNVAGPIRHHPGIRMVRQYGHRRVTVMCFTWRRIDRSTGHPTPWWRTILTFIRMRTMSGNCFDKLKDEDCIVHAHIGGRYADVDMGHDIRIERAL